MIRQDDAQATTTVEILRTRTGAIDYAAYDRRARRERAKTFLATLTFLKKAIGSGFAKTAELPAELTARSARPVHQG